MADSGTIDAGHASGYPIPAFVDWLIAVLLALLGMAMIVGGSALVFAVDRSMIAAGVADGSIESTGLTDAQTVELTLAVATWSGAGLLVVGLALLVAGVAYAIYRRRSRHAAARGESVNTFWANAVLGAVVSAVASFIPFSPALGGGVAGYFERGASRRTTTVGALSGLLAMSPLLGVLVFVLAGLVAGMTAAGESGIAVVVGTAMLLALMVIAVVGAGLGAIGGFVGGKLAADGAD